MIGETEEMAGAPAVEIEAAPEETFEQKEERLKREDYIRRNAEAIREREEILRRNGVIAPDEEFSMDEEAALRGRCCP